MRTTLTIDDDVLAAAKAKAEAEQRSLGAVISLLARRGLAGTGQLRTRDGVPISPDDLPTLPLRKDARPVTNEMINALQDDLLL